MTNEREACGRCGLSAVADVANADRDDEERAARDPYGDARIEVDERQLRAVSPGVWLSRIGDRLGSIGDRLAWGGR
jgi:hypothetical protein